MSSKVMGRFDCAVEKAAMETRKMTKRKGLRMESPGMAE
jgi:hypothetical protein